MTKQLFIIVFIVTGIWAQSSGQTFKKQFEDSYAKKDTAAELRILKRWEARDSTDAELYAAYFNYFVYKSRDLRLSELNKQKKEASQAGDKTLKNVGYTKVKPELVDKYLEEGLTYIDKGITKFPRRLDMRFGKVTVNGEIKDFQNFTNDLVKTIDYSAIIKNKWTWTNNEPVDKPEKFMLDVIQRFVVQLYNINDPALRDFMKQISENVLKYYPENVESLSNLSVVHLLNYDFDKALEVLLKAEKLAPEDHIVLANIAQTYKLKGDNKNAIRYYELTVKYGDNKAKEFAKGQIEKINNSK